MQHTKQFRSSTACFSFLAKNQKLRQTLVHTAEVVSRCFLLSQLFVSPLLSTRCRLARTTSETLRRAPCFLVFFQRWLKAVFPFLFWADYQSFCQDLKVCS
jgi:hypothetical protein